MNSKGHQKSETDCRTGLLSRLPLGQASHRFRSQGHSLLVHALVSCYDWPSIEPRKKPRPVEPTWSRSEPACLVSSDDYDL